MYQHKHLRTMSFYEIIGYLTVWAVIIYFILKVLKFFIDGLKSSLGFRIKWKTHDDDWAIITGATDGIGLEYAKRMAEKGFNLLLISRSLDKLNLTMDNIKESYPKVGEIRVLQFDFFSTDYSSIEAGISNLNRVAVLINNVGISYEYPEYFTLISNTLLEKLININVLSCTKMMHLVLPLMEKQKYGIIINLSSSSGAIPSPLLAVYSATKAYVDFLSRALAVEYKDKGIIIQSVLPSFVVTKMSKYKRPSLLIPTTKTYVNSALNQVGVKSHTSGYWPHAVQQCLLSFIGSDNASKMVFNRLKILRASAYRKYQKTE